MIILKIYFLIGAIFTWWVFHDAYKSDLMGEKEAFILAIGLLFIYPIVAMAYVADLFKEWERER